MDPASIIIAIIAIVGSIIGAVMQTEATDRTNIANQDIAEKANAAQAAENEKAYQRSKAGNQVNLMLQAGMSRAGAINALNGGGSYTPAPVNTSQMQFPTYDLSGVSNALSSLQGSYQNTKQMNESKRQFDETKSLQERELKVQESANNANIEYTKSQTLGQNIKNAQDSYNLFMQSLKDNPEQYNAIGQFKSLGVDPTQFETSSQYMSALRDKAPDNLSRMLSDASVQNALESYYNLQLLNSQVVESTKKTTAETDEVIHNIHYIDTQCRLIDEQIRKYGAEIDLLGVNHLIAQIDYQFKIDTKVNRTTAENAKLLYEKSKAELDRMKSDQFKRSYERLSQADKDAITQYKLFMEYISDINPRETNLDGYNSVQWFDIMKRYKKVVDVVKTIKI